MGHSWLDMTCSVGHIYCVCTEHVHPVFRTRSKSAVSAQLTVPFSINFFCLYQLRRRVVATSCSDCFELRPQQKYWAWLSYDALGTMKHNLPDRSLKEEIWLYIYPLSTSLIVIRHKNQIIFQRRVIISFWQLDAETELDAHKCRHFLNDWQWYDTESDRSEKIR